MIEPPDSHYLRAAEGWLELGCPAEAFEELTHISDGKQCHPKVLDMRCRIYTNTKDWKGVISAAGALVDLQPEEAEWYVRLANGFFFLGRTAEAREIALPAVRKFPKHAVLQYNLACYECQLGNFDTTRTWLNKSIALDTRLKDYAPKDPDLAPYWRHCSAQGTV